MDGMALEWLQSFIARVEKVPMDDIKNLLRTLPPYTTVDPTPERTCEKIVDLIHMPLLEGAAIGASVSCDTPVPLRPHKIREHNQIARPARTIKPNSDHGYLRVETSTAHACSSYTLS
jgi:hypothetical protein